MVSFRKTNERFPTYSKTDQNGRTNQRTNKGNHYGPHWVNMGSKIEMSCLKVICASTDVTQNQMFFEHYLNKVLRGLIQTFSIIFMKFYDYWHFLNIETCLIHLNLNSRLEFFSKVSKTLWYCKILFIFALLVILGWLVGVRDL